MGFCLGMSRVLRYMAVCLDGNLSKTEVNILRGILSSVGKYKS